ncbi:M16 family metallopeptidase [Ilumatobacter nonamiensis]|uniref:M16 family metallopeptidase n=1 Tax=Ilumatobacter nonamiensis TaxID=467093 RepID=UPI00058C0E11|nr:insulinase family protein [Ilumatobacter nonamiensis]
MVAVVVTAAIVAAACSPDADVSTESADTIVGDESTTEPPVSDSSSSEPSATEVSPTDTDVSDSDPDRPDLESLLPDADDLPALSTPDPDTLTGTLDNGLRYMVRDNDNPGSKAELRLAVDAGSVLEDESQLGGAHFLEHMLFNGTERFPKNELIDELRSFGAGGIGADVNARTGYDETVYRLTVPNADEVVETGLDILEEWLSFATIDPADVEAERGVVLDEWRFRSQTANGRIAQATSGFVLEDTPYDGRSPIGGRESIETITSEDLRRFYDDWYRPELTSVIVVGEIDPEQVEEWIVERFSDAESRGSEPARPDIVVEPDGMTRVEVVEDPELAEGALSVLLPVPVEDGSSAEADAQLAILADLAFDVLATRLDNDALRDLAPYERAGTTELSIVRNRDAPGIRVEVDGDAVGASTEAIVDEFERVERFGISQAELDRAIAVRRQSADRLIDGSGSRQDTSYASEYERHLLEGEWYVTAEEEFAFITAVLDAATPQTVAAVFTDRYTRAGAEVLVTVPSAEAAAVVPAEDLVDIVDRADDRVLDARPDDAGIADEFMARPEPVDEVDQYEMSTRPTPYLAPLVIDFGNGVSVAFNTTTIVEGQIWFEARSPGGSKAVADGDVADAQALGSVLADSGLGPFDRVELDTFLDDRDLSFEAFIDAPTDSLYGTAATDDLETLMQFVHLTMTEPRADGSAVDRYVDDRLPYAEDPSIDAGYAEYAALLEARFGGDERYVLSSPADLESVDAEGVDRVATERFGDASDWSFAFSGDFDLGSAIELARSYLGTLPAGEGSDVMDFSEPPPPPGEVVVDVAAGQGEAAIVSFQFTSSATADRRDDVLARVVREVVDNRLNDFIREELGDTYSPSASIDLGGGATPTVETYITVSTAPDLIEDVSAAALAQLDALRSDGPSEREFENARATVAEQLNFINNAQINDEILDLLVDPDGNASFDDFIGQAALVAEISADDVREAIVRWIPASDYIEIRVAPDA